MSGRHTLPIENQYIIQLKSVIISYLKSSLIIEHVYNQLIGNMLFMFV